MFRSHLATLYSIISCTLANSCAWSPLPSKAKINNFILKTPDPLWESIKMIDKKTSIGLV